MSKNSLQNTEKIRNSVDVMVSQELMDKSSDYYRKIRDFYNSLIQLPDITEDLEETTDQDAAGSVVSFVNKMSKRFDDRDGFYSWRDLRYVEERQVDGKWFQMPIEIGSSKGITMVEKTSEKGTIYEVIAYPPEVQKEVVEHFIGER